MLRCVGRRTLDTKGPSGQCGWAQPGTEGTILNVQKDFEQEMDVISFSVVFLCVCVFNHYTGV